MLSPSDVAKKNKPLREGTCCNNKTQKAKQAQRTTPRESNKSLGQH